MLLLVDEMKRVGNLGIKVGGAIHRRDLRGKNIRPHHFLSYVAKTSIGQRSIDESHFFRPRTSLDETLSSYSTVAPPP